VLWVDSAAALLSLAIDPHLIPNLLVDLVLHVNVVLVAAQFDAPAIAGAAPICRS